MNRPQLEIVKERLNHWIEVAQAGPNGMCLGCKALYYDLVDIQRELISLEMECKQLEKDMGGLLEKSVNSRSENHVCGLQGYDPMIDPPCPACK